MNRSLRTTFVLLTIFVILTSVCTAQASTRLHVNDCTFVSFSTANIVWQKSYGGAGDDRALYSLALDSGFLVVGSTKSIFQGAAGWALMLNNEGDIVWNRTYLQGAGTELRYAVNLTDGFVLVGNQFLANDVNGYIAKVDFEGKVIWETVVGGANIDKLFCGASGVDGFVVFGLTFPEGNGAKSAGWIVKLDSGGNVVWQNTYGRGTDTALRSAVYTGDGYFAAGYTDPAGEDIYDFYFLKIATDGTVLWNYTYGSADSEKVYSMAVAKDGYILAGESHSTQADADALVVKVDFGGNLIWSKKVGGVKADSTAYITPAKDGGFLVCGFTFSFGVGQRDFWLFKISDAGSVLFSCVVGDEAFQEAYGVVEEGDGRYILVGWTDPAGKIELVGKATYDFWIVKIYLSGGNDFSIALFIAICVVVFALVIASFVVFLQKRKQKMRP